MKVPQVFRFEEAVFILLQLLPDIDQLLIVQTQIQEISPQRVQSGRVFLDLPVQNGLLGPVQLQFNPGEQLRIPVNYLLQEIINLNYSRR